MIFNDRCELALGTGTGTLSAGNWYSLATLKTVKHTKKGTGALLGSSIFSF
jgi:hypothetical protein